MNGEARFPVAAAAVAAALFAAQAASFLYANSQTFDESAHIAAGYSYLAFGDLRLNPEHPPLVKVLAGAAIWLAYRPPFQPDAEQWRTADQWLIGRDFLYRSKVSADALVTVARIPGVLLGIALVVLAGVWAHRLWGRRAATAAMLLCALEPNLLANACLVQTDVAATLFTTLALYATWRYLQRPTWRLLLGVAVAVALALVSKFSCVFLLGIVPAVMLAHRFLVGGPLLPAGHPIDRAVALAVVLLLAATIIPVAYLGRGFDPWVTGLSSVISHQEGGHPGMLLGKHSSEGWWYYFPLAFLMKTPLGSLALLAASLALFRRGERLDRRALLTLLLPAVLLFAIMMRGRINIGLRHVLQVYPLLYICAARLATVRLSSRWAAPALLWGCLGLTAASTLRVAPHQLAYFNEAVGGPRAGINLLTDSNLDWGQDLRGLRRALDSIGNPTIFLSYFGSAPPSYYGIRYRFVPPNPEMSFDAVPAERRLLAISAFNLQGIRARDPNLFGWLRQREPVAVIGYSIYIYDLTNDQPGLVTLQEHLPRCVMGEDVCGIPPFLGSRESR